MHYSVEPIYEIEELVYVIRSKGFEKVANGLDHLVNQFQFDKIKQLLD